MGTVKCVGILTSGGDAPGMNAANSCSNACSNLQRTASKRYI